MTDDTTPAPIGDNSSAELFDRASDLLATADRWAKERPEITDQEMADKAAGLIEQIRLSIKALDENRLARKKPHTDAGKAIDEEYRAPNAGLKAAKEDMQGKLTTFLQAEQKRRDDLAKAQAEEAARMEREAVQQAQQAEGFAARAEAEANLAKAVEARAAVDTAPVKVGARHAGQSRSVGLRTSKVAVIEDRGKFLRWLKDDQDLADFLQKRANQLVRTGQTPPGVRIDTKQTAA